MRIRGLLALPGMLLERVRRSSDPVGFARRLGVKIGQGCVIGSRVDFGSEPYLVSMGNHVRLTSDVLFLTHDGSAWVFRDKYPKLSLVAPISIGNNCFIGIRTIILPGVTIGDNCIIGAGSTVTKSIPSNSVAAGVPARVLRQTDEYLQKILPKSLSTSGMKPGELKTYLLKHFGIPL